ncbi:hypothetical protein WMY93_003593 [Mugilogobius chulae]|uniref:ATPase AAA-type core domain-containing protein n=1 Tax=Mugilogobius chulae TaxID=88201 RepID=A0AAW0Q6X6_9GOBI
MPGSKFQDKASRKPLPVSIFDDGSKEGSENSQDDEQFKARREFLKSGLPESFKKQMAKTAAVKEAYASACASFQPVLHIYQPLKNVFIGVCHGPAQDFFIILKIFEPPTVSKDVSPEVSTEATGGKRKRPQEEEEVVKVAKKLRSARPAEKEPSKKERRTRRGAKCVPDDSSQAPAPLQSDTDIVVLDDSPARQSEPGVLTEDVLWTDKYQPQHSSEVIGNTSQVRQLHSWLKEWKLRADKEDKKKLKDQKQEEGTIDSDWECGEEDSRDAEDLLCNTLLITGPSGIGKTAAVYACAQELGFKIFEVNASSQRSGRLILSQLKEATQSHQVDTQGVNAHKPTYFNNYSASSSTVKSSPRKVGSPRRAVSSPENLHSHREPSNVED